MTASITPLLPTDGILYANQSVLPATETDLWNLTGLAQNPVGINCQNALYLFVSTTLVIAGSPGSGNAWIAIQTQLADGNWFDMAWMEKAASAGNGTYYNAFGTGPPATPAWVTNRTLGNDPGATGVHGIPLGGRLRFTGESGFNQGTATATIYYKLQGLR